MNAMSPLWFTVEQSPQNKNSGYGCKHITVFLWCALDCLGWWLWHV